MWRSLSSACHATLCPSHYTSPIVLLWCYHHLALLPPSPTECSSHSVQWQISEGERDLTSYHCKKVTTATSHLATSSYFLPTSVMSGYQSCGHLSLSLSPWPLTDTRCLQFLPTPAGNFPPDVPFCSNAKYPLSHSWYFSLLIRIDPVKLCHWFLSSIQDINIYFCIGLVSIKTRNLHRMHYLYWGSTNRK